VVIARGRVIAEGTPDTLGRDGHAVVSFRAPAFTEGLPLPGDARVDRDLVSFETSTPTRDLAPILAWASGRGMELEGLSVGRPTLEDVYLQLTEETR
jgi:ABC-2 type transport system ATP-binding protein